MKILFEDDNYLVLDKPTGVLVHDDGMARGGDGATKGQSVTDWLSQKYPVLENVGGEIEVPTLSGPAILKIPAGTQNDTMFRLRGKGMPDVHGRGHGDQLVHVVVEVPTRLSREQRDKLQEFATIAGNDAYPQLKSWLEKAKRFFHK